MNNNNQPPETTMERWEIVEMVDDAIAAGQDSEFLKNEFVYEFKQQGRVVRGLTAAMYAHLALVEGIGIQNTLRTIVDIDVGERTEKYVRCYVEAVKGDQMAPGIAMEPLMLNGRFDKFCYQKALTKACRNARKQLLPFDLVLKAIEELANPPKPKAAKPKQVEKPPSNNKAMQGAFQYYEQYKEELPSNFWDRVKAHFGKTSRHTMTMREWYAVPGFIDQLIKETEVAKADEVTEPDPVEKPEEEIPF